jgi:hypothetical protein
MEIEQYQIDLGKQVEMAMNKAIDQMHPKYILGEQSDIKFYIPKIAMYYLLIYFKHTLKEMNHIVNSGIITYRGYKITEGYELMVILVHNSYPIHNDPQSISKVKI